MIICVHGGAAATRHRTLKLQGLKDALLKGLEQLTASASAVDAVEAAVVALEDNPVFNAGYGSSLTDDGQIEMDAIVMNGRQLKSGAVAGVSRIKNPVKLARAVMEHTDHCLLISSGAEKFAQEKGVQLIDPKTLVHRWAVERLEEFRTFRNTIEQDKPVKVADDHDTVGSVALDKHGGLACATSTGGITAKMYGRVGDSPVIGAGGWADDQTGAVSTTGHGEAMMRVCLSREIMTRFEREGRKLAEAVENSLEMMAKRVDGYGGAIAVTADHQVYAGFSTEMMPWGYIDTNETVDGKVVMHFGCERNEHETVLIDPQRPEDVIF